MERIQGEVAYAMRQLRLALVRGEGSDYQADCTRRALDALERANDYIGQTFTARGVEAYNTTTGKWE